MASQQNNPDYAPLPAELIPANLVPNRNSLGYGPIDIQNAGIQQRLAEIVFQNDHTVEGRYRISHTACTRVYAIWAELKDRFKMKEFRRQENKDGLNFAREDSSSSRELQSHFC